MVSRPRKPGDLCRSLLKRQAQSMNRTLTFAMTFLLAFALLASPPSRVSVGSPENPASTSKGVLLRLPSDTLSISIDDEDKPFLLKNLDQRFEAESLIGFLHAFVVHCSKKNEAPNILVESLTKRVVDGEEAFNDCLNRMAAEHSVAVVILPVPTAVDPNTELRKFSDEFKQQKTSAPDKRQRTKR
jgi:hypothetical protein